MGSSPLRLVAAVVIACCVAALGLGATYEVTKDRIAEQEAIAEQRSLRAAAPDADTFVRLGEDGMPGPDDPDRDDVVVAAYRALDAFGRQIGWGVRVAPRGYGGPIQMAVGLESDGQVTGVSIITMNETPGLGTKIGDEEFLAQFQGWDGAGIESELKSMDAVTGATKSSNGVRAGVAAAGGLYADVLAALNGGASQ